MKRRDPTRIELKLDDIQEYEQMKRELELKNKKINPLDDAASNNGAETNGAKSRSEIIHKRIGYDPTPKQ